MAVIGTETAWGCEADGCAGCECSFKVSGRRRHNRGCGTGNERKRLRRKRVDEANGMKRAVYPEGRMLEVGFSKLTPLAPARWSYYFDALQADGL
jgi:hypothetical protein